MKPAPFKYVAATSIEEALSYKAQFGDEARFLAGGQSLIPIMNFRLARPGFLIDINRLNELSSISQNEDGVSIGALTRHGELERSAIVSSTHAIACEAIKEVAHPQIRNRGTLCGNIAHADPASEMPAVMLALQARFKAKSATGERWIEARDFFQGVFETTLADNEMLKEIELPKLETDTSAPVLLSWPDFREIMQLQASPPSSLLTRKTIAEVCVWLIAGVGKHLLSLN